MSYILEEISTTNGHTIKGFKGDYITEKIKKRGLYEKTILNFLRGHLSRIDHLVVADIGSNIGNHALDFSTYADVVYCFEPVSFICSVLEENIKINEISNIVLTNKALSNESGVDKVYICEQNFGGSSISNKDEKKDSVEIEKITGDEFFENENLERLDFVKIDVEGHEKNVLLGMMKTIKKFKPIIMLEWNDKDSVLSFNSGGLLDDLGQLYDIKVLGNNFDADYWEGKLFGAVRRRLAKIFLRKGVRLYHFDKDKAYQNILLTPK